MELGSGEILLILIVALLIYGGRLPDVARAIGRSVGELKRGLSETKNAVSSELGSVDVSLDVEPREVHRAAPAPEHLAKEDVSAPHEGELPPPQGPKSDPQGDPTRHENPN